MNKKNRASGIGRRIRRLPMILLIASAASSLVALSTAHAADPPAATAADQAAPVVAPTAQVTQADTIQPTPATSPSPETAEPIDIEVFQGAKYLSGPGASSYPSSEMTH